MIPMLAHRLLGVFSNAFHLWWLTPIIPLMAMHRLNNDLAFGANPALVWALMVFDSLVVGLLAIMAGMAFHHGGQIEPAVR